jgi:uncharacterized PurR-regulated membrane protein YhhQ (DUF165 family)
MTRRSIGLAALTFYVATVWLANYFIAHDGDQPFPGGPHVIPVGFGYEAPSGVIWVGVALLLRDVVQVELGRRAVVFGILVGAGLSYFVAPSFAWASAVAFLLSEALDFAVFTPLIDRGQTTAAVVASNATGAVVDTFVFLWIAFGSITFWQGQIIGKMWATVAVLPVLWWMHHRREEVHTHG